MGTHDPIGLHLRPPLFSVRLVKFTLDAAARDSNALIKITAPSINILSALGQAADLAVLITKQVETVDDYDEYCHYAAGLVGLGLSKLFLTSQLEVLTPDSEHLSNSMGLFLQVRPFLSHIGLQFYFIRLQLVSNTSYCWSKFLCRKQTL